MSAKQRLEERLMKIAMGRANDSSHWMHRKEIEKIDSYNTQPEVEFEPKDAKTLDEVERFKLTVDISGTEVTTFERME